MIEMLMAFASTLALGRHGDMISGTLGTIGIVSILYSGRDWQERRYGPAIFQTIFGLIFVAAAVWFAWSF